VTAIAHVLLGAALHNWLGAWAWPLAVLSHGLLDSTSLWHPPGMHKPWAFNGKVRTSPWQFFRRAVLDEWQYGSVRVAVFCGHGVTPAYRVVKWAFFLLNCAGLLWWFVAPFLGWLSWSAWFCGWVAWLSWDIAWAVRDLAPAWYYRARVWRFNPHRLADKLRRLLRLPSDWLPGAAWEFAVIAAAWWLA